MKHAKGFTLIEVLIALAIVAIAVAAVLQVIAHTVHNTQVARDRMMAQWVARNVLAECQVGLWSVEQNPEHHGKAILLGQTWQWQARRVSSDFLPALTVPLEITVSKQGKRWVRWHGRC